MMREPAFTLLPRPEKASLSGKAVLVLGLGDTGLSVARWVERHGGRVKVADTRSAPPMQAQFGGEVHAGPFRTALLEGVDLLCISPGLSLEEEIVRAAVAKRIPVLGDVELFAWQNRSPVLAITGTNGKSTVTAMTGHLLRVAGLDCEVAGNIAPPVLRAFQARLDSKKMPAAWVLELSSYQLETTWSLSAAAAAMLNLSEDHLDRYTGIEDYGAAKARIFAGAAVQVLNRDDPASLAMALAGKKQVTFGLDAPLGGDDFGLLDGHLVHGSQAIVRADELGMHGRHNVANALAACALASSIGVSRAALAAGLKTFHGLPHRLQLVARRRGVDWYDDSKGTNVGATVAALRGLDRRAVLILGGEGKGQHFAPLREPVSRYAARVLLIGRDAPLIEKALAGLPTERCASLEAAVKRAAQIPAQAVLLSPACASFDMFRDYRHRGEAFAQAVKDLGP